MADLPRIALSIRQPWAWAILHAGKRIENRTWATSYRGPFCIHAAKGMTGREQAEFDGFIKSMGLEPPNYGGLPRGGIVGTARLVSCTSSSASPWFFGPYGFVLDEVQPVDFIPCKGKLAFFSWEETHG